MSCSRYDSNFTHIFGNFVLKFVKEFSFVMLNVFDRLTTRNRGQIFPVLLLVLMIENNKIIILTRP